MTQPRERVIAALAVVLGLAGGCGGDDGNESNGRGGTDGAGSSMQAADYARAERAMAADDYDTAIKLMSELGGYRDARRRRAGFRAVAARETLANARRKLRRAPQAAVALTRTSLRYRTTPEAREFLPRAQRALRRFQRRERAAGRGD